YLSLLPDARALALLGEAVDVLALIGGKLERNRSPYHAVFKVLENLSPVQAQGLTRAPVRDMDEAMAEFGPTPDGVEPLLVPKPHTVTVQPPRRTTAATQACGGFNRETPR
ncbi:MAG: nitrate reductase molybdenum cofactor assembly chaperone, partial [Gammaproteobacteria bacterium]|nr:nitrate reductase molybdenum cofactor assembly chaperone [Gammaproteobacteria bacterium]